MKLGQTLSVELSDLLPPEVVQALSRLQDQGDSLSGAQIRKILQQEWGESLYGQLDGFVDVPLASASIGQVHAARWNGQDIVLKVQFPGIGETIDSDIQGLSVLIRGLLTLTGKKVNLESLLEELSEVFRQETDYRKEATFLEEYRVQIQPYSEYRVPQVYSQLSTSRVLGMTRERGLRPLDWLKLRQPSIQVRNELGRRFLRLYELEFFHFGLVQTDPNYANFLIDDSASRENPILTLLDFGAAKRYAVSFRQAYQQLLRIGREGSDSEILEQCFQLNLLDRAECPEAREALVSLIRASLSPFDPKQQPFRFADAHYAQEMREKGLKLVQACQVSPPPRPILFLHRKLGGIFHLLKTMEVELDLTTSWERMVLQEPWKIV
jgi:predicted unusual protein kinase regulating ubiquinone biosynthesis (AarF/ABC1/UbiB family)